MLLVLEAVGGREPKVNKDCFSSFIYHNIVWLDVAMHNTYDLLAVVQRLQHVNKEATHLPVRHASFEEIRRGEFIGLGFVFEINAVHFISEAAIFVICSDEID